VRARRSAHLAPAIGLRRHHAAEIAGLVKDS
jgi:hypothetical protein